MNPEDFEPRDVFAALALVGLLSGQVLKAETPLAYTANLAYTYADALMEARKRKPE